MVDFEALLGHLVCTKVEAFDVEEFAVAFGDIELRIWRPVAAYEILAVIVDGVGIGSDSFGVIEAVRKLLVVFELLDEGTVFACHYSA